MIYRARNGEEHKDYILQKELRAIINDIIVP